MPGEGLTQQVLLASRGFSGRGYVFKGLRGSGNPGTDITRCRSVRASPASTSYDHLHALLFHGIESMGTHSFMIACHPSQVLVDVVLYRERALSLLSDMSSSLVTLTVSEGVGEGASGLVRE